MTLLGKLLLGVGAALFVAAVGWWYMFYEQFFGQDVKQASTCFYVTSDVCALGEYAAIVSDIPVYSPWILWVAAASLLFGVLLLGFAPLKARS